MPLGTNYDYDLQNQRYQNQLQIANAMQQGALKPMELPTAGAGQQQAAVNPLMAVLGPMLQSYMAQKMKSNVQAKQDELGARYKQDLIDGMQQFYEKSNGGWKHDQTPGAGEDSNADITQVAPQDSWNYQAPDQKGAILAALASNHPVVQQMGQAGLAGMFKNDPMAQLLGTNQQAGVQPPQEVLDSGNYTVNGQAPQAGVAGAPQAPNAPAGGSFEDKIKRFFPMVDPQQARALLAADPTGKTLAEENAHRSRMVVAGDNVYQPTGPGQVALPQGVIPARTAIKQADAGVADQHELVNSADPVTGAPMTRTKAQAIGMTGQGNPLLDQLNPADRAKVMQYAQQSGQKVFDVDFAGANGQRVQGTIDLTGARNGASAGQNGFVSGQAPAVAKEQQGYAEKLATARDQIDSDAETALSVKARIGELRETSAGFTSGVTTPLKEKLGGLAIALGQDPDAVNKRLGNISDMQAFNKEATQMAFDMVKQLGSREAASVVNMAIKSSASLGNTPAANKSILDVMEGMADWKLARQDAATQWVDQHGTLAGFATAFNKQHPMTEFIHVTKASSPMPQGMAGGPVQAGKPPAGAPVPKNQPIPLDQYLKQMGVH